ncbi:hypothetical protein EHS25_005456 [Saitozyma podzolica]|uniref:TECPR1-like DysF domain-containing protein n=1 Tax=Saitozyma podzolica TaxID=1890683 RepID=A0A427XYE2_9TREE|nr:hypothetical protein EHS25_005456 [Saitozyma podzolica]
MVMSAIPSYVSVPPSAHPIDPPAGGTTSQRLPSRPAAAFPPTNTSAGPSSRKFSVPSATGISTNVSDLLLSSLLPPNLPKLPAAGPRGPGGSGPGKPRELSTQRETLSLPVLSNNFRRFVTRVGPLFWVQDRVEEVLFWRKPMWTWAWLIAWTFISFKPRLLLLAPFLSIIALLLHLHERSTPLPSLIGVSQSPPSAGTTRLAPVSGPKEASMSATTGADGEPIPAVPPKEAESSVDYYMNIQAIQNTMGWISDAYDIIAPQLAAVTSPSASPTAFPITLTHLLLVLLVPSICLPLLPDFLIPYLLLPLGILPPLFFHPNLTQATLSLPRNATLLRVRSTLETLALSDTLPDWLTYSCLSRVEVWENERLDPAVASKTGPIPSGAYAARHLRAGERAPWVKVGLRLGETIEGSDSGDSVWASAGEAVPAEGGSSEKVLALKDGWAYIPGEDWRVDVCGLWSEVGTDEDGWAYSDDSWQNPAPVAVTEADVAGTGAGGTMPGMGLRRVTRRRRWWRRVYKEV